MPVMSVTLPAWLAPRPVTPPRYDTPLAVDHLLTVADRLKRLKDGK